MHGPYIPVHGKSNKKHQIKHYHGCYDPLQYPIIFPLGDYGWHPGLKKVADNVKRVIIPGTAVASNSAAKWKRLLLMQTQEHTPHFVCSLSYENYFSYIINRSSIT